MKRAWLLYCALAVSGQVKALTVPGPCEADEHVQCAVYDPDEVYQVVSSFGQATMIEFEPGEFVEQKGAGMGDGKAWEASSTKNWILLKPALSQPDTNFLVMTNRRRYVISLVSDLKKGPTTWSLSFTYPDTQARAAAEKAKREGAANAAFRGRSKDTGGKHNTSYSMRGDTVLAPTGLWDDGMFTHFEYDTGRDLPKVYAKLEDGTEALANYHMDGDTVVVHETAKEFVIRQGKLVLGIRNDAYAPDGNYNWNGTSAPEQVRVVKEKAE
jgi:type IV secretion system protein VirB9